MPLHHSREVNPVPPVKVQIGADKVPISRHVEANVAINENVLTQRKQRVNCNGKEEIGFETIESIVELAFSGSTSRLAVSIVPHEKVHGAGDRAKVRHKQSFLVADRLAFRSRQQVALAGHAVNYNQQDHVEQRRDDEGAEAKLVNFCWIKTKNDLNLDSRISKRLNPP